MPHGLDSEHLFFVLVPTPLASTPEELREEKKEQEGEKGAGTEESKAAKAKASKPLMPTSTILRLLAELVRSYVGIATLIASYSYTAGQSELIKEVGTMPKPPLQCRLASARYPSASIVLYSDLRPVFFFPSLANTPSGQEK